jgi:hypothetical protein
LSRQAKDASRTLVLQQANPFTCLRSLFDLAVVDLSRYRQTCAMTFLTRIAVRVTQPNNSSSRQFNENGGLRNDNLSILACSAMTREQRELVNMHKLCSERKGFADHLMPSQLGKSVS